VLRIVNRVDPTILDTQISQIRNTVLPTAVDQQLLGQILDIAFIRYEGSGREYGQQVLELLQDVEKASTSSKVFKEVVERFLTDARIPSTTFHLSRFPAPHSSLVDRRSGLCDIVLFPFYRCPRRTQCVPWPYRPRYCSSSGY